MRQKTKSSFIYAVLFVCIIVACVIDIACIIGNAIDASTNEENIQIESEIITNTESRHSPYAGISQQINEYLDE